MRPECDQRGGRGCGGEPANGHLMGPLEGITMIQMQTNTFTWSCIQITILTPSVCENWRSKSPWWQDSSPTRPPSKSWPPFHHRQPLWVWGEYQLADIINVPLTLNEGVILRVYFLLEREKKISSPPCEQFFLLLLYYYYRSVPPYIYIYILCPSIFPHRSHVCLSVSVSVLHIIGACVFLHNFSMGGAAHLSLL